MTSCNRPPEGWYCTKNAGHDGPCPTWRYVAYSKETQIYYIEKALDATEDLEERLVLRVLLDELKA